MSCTNRKATDLKRIHEKHLPYFRVLEALQGSKGCALCALEDGAVKRYLEGILYEKVNDQSIRDDLKKSGGFCARHAHRLADLGDGLGTAILYQDQIRRILDALEKDGSAAAKARRGRTSIADRSARCPACRFAEQTRARNTRTLLDALDDADMHEALRGSGGLCYPHLLVAAGQADERRRARLMEVHRPKLSVLLHMLEEYQRKQDYRFAAEADAEESDSWLRAIEVATGRRGVF